MKVTKFNINHKNKTLSNGSVFALGKFETLHLGHQKVFDEAKKISIAKDLELNIMIFPAEDNLFSDESRLETLQLIYEPSNILVFEPTKENFKTSIKEFSDYLINNFNTKDIVVGEDFTFNKYDDDVNELKESFELKKVQLINFNNEKLSSTTLNELFKQKEITIINELLMEKIKITGKVIRGNGEATKLGYPTANLELNSKALQPGTYETITIIGGEELDSISFYSDNKFETHIFDFNKEIYGEVINVYIERFISEPVEYISDQQMIEKIQKDIEKRG